MIVGIVLTYHAIWLVAVSSRMTNKPIASFKANLSRKNLTVEDFFLSQNEDYFMRLGWSKGDVYFDNDNVTDVVGYAQGEVCMHCNVRNLGSNTVSWIRLNDYQLLTVGPILHSRDARFQINYFREPQDWRLRVVQLQREDEGVYECQVSTHPPLSIFVNLILKTPKAVIQGHAEVFVEKGSRFSLKCDIQDARVPSHVEWWHNNKSVVTTGNVKIYPQSYSSIIEVRKTLQEHSGEYSCSSYGSEEDHITVHIINEENPAAIQSSQVKLYDEIKVMICFLEVVLIQQICVFALSIFPRNILIDCL